MIPLNFRLESSSCEVHSHRLLCRLTDIQVPDIQVSDTQVPDIQVPGRPGLQTSRSFGHPGPWTSKSPDVQAFRTSRSFGHPGPWTSKSPDNQAFRTSRSSDVQVFRTSRSYSSPALLEVNIFRMLTEFLAEFLAVQNSSTYR